MSRCLLGIFNCDQLHQLYWYKKWSHLFDHCVHNPCLLWNNHHLRSHQTLLRVQIRSWSWEEDPKRKVIIKTVVTAKRWKWTQEKNEEFRVQVQAEPQPVPTLQTPKQVPHRKPTPRRTHEPRNLFPQWQTQSQRLKEGNLLLSEVPYKTIELVEDKRCWRVPKTHKWNGS